jgi:hypothetical protein
MTNIRFRSPPLADKNAEGFRLGDCNEANLTAYRRLVLPRLCWVVHPKKEALTEQSFHEACHRDENQTRTMVFIGLESSCIYDWGIAIPDEWIGPCRINPIRTLYLTTFDPMTPGATNKCYIG